MRQKDCAQLKCLREACIIGSDLITALIPSCLKVCLLALSVLFLISKRLSAAGCAGSGFAEWQHVARYHVYAAAHSSSKLSPWSALVLLWRKIRGSATMVSCCFSARFLTLLASAQLIDQLIFVLRLVLHLKGWSVFPTASFSLPRRKRW